MKKIKSVIVLVLIVSAACYAYTHFPAESETTLYYGEAVGDSYNVYAATAGLLESLTVSEGAFVEVGQLVASLSYKDLDEQLALAEKDMEIAAEQLNKVGAPAKSETIAVLENNLATSKANRDLISANLKKAQIALKEAEIAKAQGADMLAQAQKDYDTMQALFDAGVATQAELDKLSLALDQTESNRNALDLRLELAEASVNEVEKQYRLNTLSQDTANQNLALAEAGADDYDRQLAALALEKAILARDRIQKQIDDYSVTVYKPGVVESVYYDLGEFVPTGAPLFSLYDPEVLMMKIYVKESDLALIDVGQKLDVHLADDTLAAASVGTIEHISEQAMFTPVNIVTVEDRERLVFEVTINLERSDAVRPGMLLAVDIEGDSVGGAAHE